MKSNAAEIAKALERGLGRKPTSREFRAAWLAYGNWAGRKRKVPKRITLSGLG